MTLVNVLAEDRRLVILRSLSEVPGYQLNESTLRQCLRSIGHQVTRDQARADIEFLRTAGLVRVETLHPASGELLLVTLTDAGNEVAGGVFHPGVARRSPG